MEAVDERDRERVAGNEQSASHEDERLAKDLEATRQRAQDAAAFHERELFRARSIMEACAAGLNVLTESDALHRR